MKILMLCDFFGDSQQYQENIMGKYYVMEGHKVVVIASNVENIFDYMVGKNFKNSLQYEAGDIKIYRRPFQINLFNKIKRFASVFGILEQEKPDLIYVHHVHFNLNDAVRYKKKYGCEIILDYHADFGNSGKNWISRKVLHGIIYKVYIKAYIKYIKKIFAVTPGSIDFMHQNLGIKKEEIELLPLGCDYEASQKIFLSEDRSQLRKQFDIPQDTFVIFTGGKLNPEKRTDILIEAVAKMNDEKVLLLIAGEAPADAVAYKNHLEMLAKNTNVRFLGWLASNEILKTMLISDLAVFPASQSVLWQQSIGMHLPLIVGSTKEQNAAYLNYANNLIDIDAEKVTASQLSDIISELKNDPYKLNDMKKGAEKTAREFLDYKIIAQRSVSTH